MYELAGVSDEVEDFPPREATLAYYTDRAPAKPLPLPDDSPHGPGPLRFRTRGFRPPRVPPGSGVAYLKFVNLFDARRQDLIACDMLHGIVWVQQFYLPGQPFMVLAEIPNPAHAEVVDLDRDGKLDLLVANLGSFQPEDHDRGTVEWLRGLGAEQFELIQLLDKVGRVADVQPGDVDGDGDLDLAVAVFGWRLTGKVLFLENTGRVDDRGTPMFNDYILDPRQGAINVPIVDINHDGRLDIVALLAQQHETVAAYLNDGKGDFDTVEIFKAPHPDWGSSGIEVVDLDRDGDLDVVMVNGDTLDSKIPIKPFHGVHWLENEGKFPFRAHRLAVFPGAHKVRATDLDGDGDLDLVASSFLPQLRTLSAKRTANIESVIWLEQVAPGTFETHVLESGEFDHPSLEVGDYDRNGTVDIITGTFIMEQATNTNRPWLTFFERR
jgi:hypothetical protein